MTLQQIAKKIKQIDLDLPNLEHKFNNLIFEGEGEKHHEWKSKYGILKSSINSKKDELSLLKLQQNFLSNGLTVDALFDSKLITLKHLEQYASYNNISLSQMQLNAILTIFKRSDFFMDIQDMNVINSQAIGDFFHIFKSFDYLLISFYIMKEYHPLKKFNGTSFLSPVLQQTKNPDLEGRYLDSFVEVSMLNYIYQNIIKNINDITFDLKSDILSTGNPTASQVELIINHKNIKKIKVECKRRDFSVFKQLQIGNVEMDVEAYIEKQKKFKFKLSENWDNINLIKAHDIIIANIESKISGSAQLSANFNSNTKNIFYCSIDGFQTSSVNDYKDLGKFMYNYYIFSQNYKLVTENCKSNFNHYSKINLISDFDINLAGQIIDYIFISFSDIHIVWKITATNKAKIIYSHIADAELKSLFN